MHIQNTNMDNFKPSSKIIGVQFSILSPEEIRKNSVVEVTSRDTYINNKPVVGGLFDPRMGVLEPGLICPTDGYTYIDTPGYFGHIELARPVLFIQHLKEIMKICKCVCFKCSKLKINKNLHKHVLNMSQSERWHYITNIAPNVKRCGDCTEDGCGYKQPDKIQVEGMSTIQAIWEKMVMTDGNTEKVILRLTPEMLIKIFKRICDEDVNFMGFSPVWSRPEWMICQVLPVPPPAVRPSVKHDAQQRSEDDLTHIYSNIIKTNNDLRDKIANNAATKVIEVLSGILQYFVAMIANNKVKGADPMAQRSGRPLNCISGRLNSKNGRIRGNLMGKRVDFSARSVITGDPNLSIRQLGVPLKIARNITKPVTVNDRNRNFLMKLVQNGPDGGSNGEPGAKILERKSGENISLRYVDTGSIRLENGDIVHRHMMDGDAVLFNRQPSLHRMSMMCHIVKIMKRGDTFRMNVGDTKPYNADFDGDEMNMHMPQSILAETELKNLAAIPYQMISPAKNSPIIGIFQDSMLGSYRFTRPNISFSPREAMNLLMLSPNVNMEKLRENGDKISSFDILSQILPPVTLKYKTELYDEDEEYDDSNNVLEIRNGEYIRGQMEKNVLGSTTKGIIHRICNDYGNMRASDYIDDMQNIITEYMKSSSFSVGISDLIADRKTQDSIIHAILTQKQEVQSIIEKVHLGIFENNTSTTNITHFETNINNVLNKATEQAGKIGRTSLSKNNRFLMIVNSGSKGNLINISQMISCLGQTNVDGKRIPYGFDNRTLPHFSKFDDTPGARGFIENSYISGLTAPELFFHAMGGRIGLIDTAVKTSQTGYIQRRLIKGLEDIKVEYDMTVRNGIGKIIQFRYGDDNFDSTKTENQKIPLATMTTEDIYNYYDIAGVNNEKTVLKDIYTKGTISRRNKRNL
jgi:DNA-directed RNA polymerase II subunit RPB1